jgi:clumping factor A
MRRPILCASVFLWAAVAGAAPKLRAQVDQRGDFALIGNTLGHDCRAGIPAPIVGSVGDSGTHTSDSSPDVFWRDGSADSAITLDEARSTAVLSLPAGATVSHAWLYWAARRSGTSADTVASFEGPGGPPKSVSATESFFLQEAPNEGHYQSVADVSSLVQAAGSGAYRVSGVDSLPLPNLDQHVAFSGWYLVVFYELASAPPRNLALFDGLDLVDESSTEAATLSGFLVPEAGFDAKLGVVTFEGDFDHDGDSLSFGGKRLSDSENPADNFFNGTRSWLGSAVSVPGDLPQLTGAAGSMSGLDLDVIDIGAHVVAKQTSAKIEAESSGDVFLLGAFVTSISTLSPDFSSSSKSVLDVNGGSSLPGDVFEYTIVVENTGSDTAVDVVLTDALPPGVTYLPGSLAVSGNAQTDTEGDDRGEFTSESELITVRLGSLLPGESARVTFRVTLDADAPSAIANQAQIKSAGALGAPLATTLTDGDADASGPQSTLIVPDGGADADETLRGGGCGCAAPGSAPNRGALFVLLFALAALIRFLSRPSVDDVGAA